MIDSEGNFFCDQCKFRILCMPRRACGKHFCNRVCEDIWFSENEVVPIGNNYKEVV